MECLECAKPLTGKQTKFCSQEHKNKYNHRVKYSGKYQRDWRAKSPRNYLSQLRSHKKRKDSLSLDFIMSLYEDQKGLCAVTKLPMTYEQGQGRCATNISIDRIDSKQGYTETNVRLVCHQVNMMKMEHTDKDLLLWCERIINGIS